MQPYSYTVTHYKYGCCISSFVIVAEMCKLSKMMKSLYKYDCLYFPGCWKLEGIVFCNKKHIEEFKKEINITDEWIKAKVSHYESENQNTTLRADNNPNAIGRAAYGVGC